MIDGFGFQYQSEKEEFAQHYQGELCSYLSYQDRRRRIWLVSYCVACFLKLVNAYNYYWVKLNLESRILDKKMSEIYIHNYFKFFWVTLRDAESSSTFHHLLSRETTLNRPKPQNDAPLVSDITKNCFIIVAGLSMYYGALYEDSQLFNMGLICMLEV